MDNEDLQFKIDRLSHDEMAKILLDVAAQPGVRDHITTAVETVQPQNAQNEQNDSASSVSTAPPPYSSSERLSNHLRRFSPTYDWRYDHTPEAAAAPSRPANSDTRSPCVCRNCKRLFWRHEQAMAVTDCVGHPGSLQKLEKVITSRRKRRMVEAKYLDAYSGLYKCWTCCLQKKSAPGCTTFDHHIAA